VGTQSRIAECKHGKDLLRLIVKTAHAMVI
jgi:hypothetical protein